MAQNAGRNPSGLIRVRDRLAMLGRWLAWPGRWLGVQLADKHGRVLLWTFLSTAVTVGVFGFGVRGLNGGLYATFGWHLSDSQSWEFGALVCNFVFAAVFYATYPDVTSFAIKKLIPVVLIIGFLGCSIMALITLVSNQPHAGLWHVCWVLAIGLIFLLCDGLLCKFVDAADVDEKKLFRQCLLLADLPMNGAFAILLAFYWSHPDATNMEDFFAGAVGFQLIASNVIFGLIQGKVVQRCTT